MSDTQQFLHPTSMIFSRTPPLFLNIAMQVSVSRRYFAISITKFPLFANCFGLPATRRRFQRHPHPLPNQNEDHQRHECHHAANLLSERWERRQGSVQKPTTAGAMPPGLKQDQPPVAHLSSLSMQPYHSPFFTIADAQLFSTGWVLWGFPYSSGRWGETPRLRVRLFPSRPRVGTVVDACAVNRSQRPIRTELRVGDCSQPPPKTSLFYHSRRVVDKRPSRLETRHHSGSDRSIDSIGVCPGV